MSSAKFMAGWPILQADAMGKTREKRGQEKRGQTGRFLVLEFVNPVRVAFVCYSPPVSLGAPMARPSAPLRLS
jgi:hypothetical protein